jgi:hypothetical protein
MLLLLLYHWGSNCAVRMIRSPLWAGSRNRLVVLSNILNQDISDYAWRDVEMVVSPVNNVVAPATQLTCLQLPTLDVLTRSGDSGGHIQRNI